MSFLDKVTKAVGDVVDKGKKDVDQFMRIQKINGEISAMEKKIAGFGEQVKLAKAEAGGKVIEMLRSGAMTSPELQTYLDQVIGLEHQIEAEQSNIVGKRADIDRIKAEHEAEHAAAVPAGPPPVAPAPPPIASAPVAPPPLPTEPAAVVPPPPAAAGGKFCMQCGAQLTGGAFCPQCGAKVG